MAPGIACDNFKIEAIGANQLQLVLQMHNTLGFPMKPEAIEITVKDPQKGSETTYLLTGGTGISYSGSSVKDGESLTIIQAFPVISIPQSGTLYRIKFGMNYTNQGVTPATTHRTAGVINVRTTG